MKEPARFIYREFYDVPRTLIVRYREMQLLLESAFDKSRDEYADSYRVFVLPDLTDDEFFGSWDALSKRATRFLGEIPVNELHFDSTKRQHLDTALLDDLVKGDRRMESGDWSV